MHFCRTVVTSEHNHDLLVSTESFGEQTFLQLTRNLARCVPQVIILKFDKSFNRELENTSLFIDLPIHSTWSKGTKFHQIRTLWISFFAFVYPLRIQQPSLSFWYSTGSILPRLICPPRYLGKVNAIPWLLDRKFLDYKRFLLINVAERSLAVESSSPSPYLALKTQSRARKVASRITVNATLLTLLQS